MNSTKFEQNLKVKKAIDYISKKIKPEKCIL